MEAAILILRLALTLAPELADWLKSLHAAAKDDPAVAANPLTPELVKILGAKGDKTESARTLDQIVADQALQFGMVLPGADPGLPPEYQ